MSYLFEMHLHTKEVSTCANVPSKKIAELFSSSKYSGVIVTDHLKNWTFEAAKLENASWDEKIDFFLTGYKELKKDAGEKMTVLLGAEVNFDDPDNDYLIYGLTEEFLRAHPEILDLNPKKFYLLAKENGLIFVQAHPFRRGLSIEDWQNLDGYEVYNGNPRHESSNEIAKIWAKYHNKDINVSGSDFHIFEDFERGGVYFENEIKSNEDLVRELKSLNYKLKEG